MKTTALRIHGKNDLRLDTFDLPEPKEDEILAEVVTNSICMSCHKAAILGPEHKRVPKDVDVNPTIIGHEFAGVLRWVGPRWADKFKVGQKFSIQPALGYKGSLDAPGYSFRTIGGMASFIVIPSMVMEQDCLLPYGGDGFFKASLSEPMSCIVGAAHAEFHTKYGSYKHTMGIQRRGECALLAAAGPMGLGFVDYLTHGPRKPKLLVVTDIDQARLDRAAQWMTVEDAKKNGVKLLYVNTASVPNPVEYLRGLTQKAEGFDDVFVLAPVPPVIEQGDDILRRNGCLNFFAGPTKTDFKARFNFYNVHYGETHIIGTSGGNTDDMRESLQLMGENKVNPAVMVTHIAGITAGADTILRLPEIPGGKKLVYTQCDFPLTALADLDKAGQANPVFATLAEICRRNKDLWSVEAEEYLLANAPKYRPI